MGDIELATDGFYQSQVTYGKKVIIKMYIGMLLLYKFQHKYGFMNIKFTYL